MLQTKVHGWRKQGAGAPPDFGRLVNPISTRFSDLPPSLIVRTENLNVERMLDKAAKKLSERQIAAEFWENS